MSEKITKSPLHFDPERIEAMRGAGFPYRTNYAKEANADEFAAAEFLKEVLAMPLKDQPQVQPGQLNAKDLLKFLKGYCHKLEVATTSQVAAVSHQEFAKQSNLRAVAALNEFLEESRLHSQMSTLFPEWLKPGECVKDFAAAAESGSQIDPQSHPTSSKTPEQDQPLPLSASAELSHLEKEGGDSAPSEPIGRSPDSNDAC